MMVNDTEVYPGISIYDSTVSRSADGLLFTIINLCRVGVAATDTGMSIDLSKCGHCDMYETIAQLAAEAIEILETK